MSEILSEKIDVEKAETSPTPVSFTWRGEVHAVAEVLEERVDTGFGTAPDRSRKWFTRRHRRYFVVRDSAGDVFEIYLDYANRGNQTWWLLKKREQGSS